MLPKYLVAAATMLGFTHAVAHADNQSEALLQYFGNQCRSVGVFERNAYEEALQFRQMLVEMAENPKCKPTSERLAALMPSVELQLLRLETDRPSREIQALSHERDLLRAALASGEFDSDPTTQAVLRQRFNTVIANIITTEGVKYGYGDGRNYQRENVAQGVGQLLRSTNELFRADQDGQECLIQHPGILKNLGMLAAGVASVAAPPGVALGLTAGTELIDQLMHHERMKKYFGGKVDTSLRATAYRCSLEAFSNQWCTAESQRKLVQLQIEAQKEQQKQKATQAPSETEPAEGYVGPPTKFSRAFKILRTHLPNAIAWLETVRAGVPPSGEAIGNDRANAQDEDNLVEKLGTSIIQGVISERHDEFLAQKDEIGRWTVVKTVIVAIQSKIGSASSTTCTPVCVTGPNPFYDLVDSTTAPYRLLGIDDVIKKRPNLQTGLPTFPDFTTFAQNPFDKDLYISPILFSPKLDDVARNFGIWYRAVKARTSSRRQAKQNPNPISIFSAAKEFDRNQSSPLRSLKEILAYFEQYPARRGDDFGYSEARDTLREIVRVIEGGFRDDFVDELPVVDNPKRQTAEFVLSKVFSLAMLNQGTETFRSIVEKSVLKRLDEVVMETPNDGFADLVASNDLVADLQLVSGKRSLYSIRDDLESARNVIGDKMSDFSANSDFIKGIRQSFNVYPRNKRERALLCFGLLALDTWPASIPKEECLGEHLDYVDGHPSITIDAAAFSLPQAKRACVIHDYQRDEDILSRKLDHGDERGDER